jgi:hypothetical protein
MGGDVSEPPAQHTLAFGSETRLQQVDAPLPLPYTVPISDILVAISLGVLYYVIAFPVLGTYCDTFYPYNPRGNLPMDLPLGCYLIQYMYNMTPPAHFPRIDSSRLDWEGSCLKPRISRTADPAVGVRTSNGTTTGKLRVPRDRESSNRNGTCGGCQKPCINETKCTNGTKG